MTLHRLRHRLSWSGSCLSILMVMLPFAAFAKGGVDESNTIVDVRCVVVGARLSESLDQTQKLSGEMLLAYFLGRVDGRSPNANLETLIEREAQKMTASVFANEAHRCSEEFSMRGAEIVRIGKDLQQLGR